MLEAWRILTLAEKNNISLQLRHIPGHLNVMADCLSRKGQILSHRVEPQGTDFSGSVSCNVETDARCIATSFNHKLPFNISPFPDAKGLAVDDVSLNWTGKKSCAGCFQQRLHCQSIHGSWTVSVPMQLPKVASLLKQPGNPPLFARNVQMRNLQIWGVDVTVSSNKMSLADRILAPQRPSGAGLGIFVKWAEGEITSTSDH